MAMMATFQAHGGLCFDVIWDRSVFMGLGFGDVGVGQADA
jgi:hypothetical protein